MVTLVVKWSAYPSPNLPATPTPNPSANWTGASCVKMRTYWRVTQQYTPAVSPCFTTRFYSPATSKDTGYDWGSNKPPAPVPCLQPTAALGLTAGKARKLLITV